MKKSIAFVSLATLGVALPAVLHSNKALSAVPVQTLATATTLPLKAGTVLKKGMKLTSPSGNHVLAVGTDGNMCVYTKSGGYVWGLDQVIDFTKVNPERVELRADGSLGAYNAQGAALWKAPVTRLDPQATLSVTNDGILQLTTPNEILWASKGAVGPLNQNLPNTPEFDSNKYYRLTSLFIGKGKSLNVSNSVEDRPVHLANSEVSSEANLKGTMGQYWKIEKLTDGYYRIKPLFRYESEGLDMSLDVDNMAEDSLVLSRTDNVSGQAWKIEKNSDGYYRLTNKLVGAGKSLDVVNDGEKKNVQLAPTGEFTGQAWIITEIPTPAKPTTPKPTTPNTPTGAALTVEQELAEKFRSMAAFDDPIDAEKPNYVLINEAVYFVTNEARVKQGKSRVPYHPLLAKAAFDYAHEMVTKDFFSHDHPSDPAQRTPSDRGKRAGIKNANLAENIATRFGIQYEAGKSIIVMDATKGVISYTSPEGPAIPMHTYRSLAQSLVDGWMKSPGHRANILSDDSRSLGCGVYFFRDRNFNNVLRVKAVQKFQLLNDVEE